LIDLVVRVEKQLAGWKEKLSLKRRITLNLVLLTIPLYHLSFQATIDAKIDRSNSDKISTAKVLLITFEGTLS